MHSFRKRNFMFDPYHDSMPLVRKVLQRSSVPACHPQAETIIPLASLTGVCLACSLAQSLCRLLPLPLSVYFSDLLFLKSESFPNVTKGSYAAISFHVFLTCPLHSQKADCFFSLCRSLLHISEVVSCFFSVSLSRLKKTQVFQTFFTKLCGQGSILFLIIYDMGFLCPHLSCNLMSVKDPAEAVLAVEDGKYCYLYFRSD